MTLQTLSLDDLLKSLDVDISQEKQASAVESGAPVASVELSAATELEQTLTKKANETEVNTQMANVAEKGKAIADSILMLVKQATDGLAPTAPENRLISETAAQVAQSTAGTAEIPGGTMTQVLQGLVANSSSNGAIRDEALAENAAGNGDETNAALPQLSSDGSVLAAVAAGGAPEMAEEVEKVAAVVTLVDHGYDFETAVAMVKAAEEEILADEFEQVKIAAVNELMNEGMDLESAVALVKEAAVANPKVIARIMGGGHQATVAGKANAAIHGAASTVKGGAKAVADAASDNAVTNAVRGQARRVAPSVEKMTAAIQNKAGLAKEDARALFTTNPGIGLPSRGAAALGLAKNPVVYGPALAGGAAIAGGVALSGNEKKAAAIETLVAHGYSVAEALDILG